MEAQKSKKKHKNKYKEYECEVCKTIIKLKKKESISEYLVPNTGMFENGYFFICISCQVKKRILGK